MYFSVLLVVLPPDVLCLPPSIVSKWRGLRELAVQRARVGARAAEVELIRGDGLEPRVGGTSARKGLALANAESIGGH